MKKPVQMVLFGLMCAAMLALPASQICRYERVLREGRAFKFRTAPVDPYDAFRGRYVQLRFDSLTGTLPPGMEFGYGNAVNVAVGEDAQGFAVVKAVSGKPPEGTPDYVTMDMGGYADYSNRVVQLSPPFDRFFMNERLAPAAEEAYRRMNRRGTATACWAVVRVLNGKGVIENLMFDGVPAADYVRDQLPVK